MHPSLLTLAGYEGQRRVGIVHEAFPPLPIHPPFHPPSPQTFREVETLLHESGHALQHMLTRCDEGLVSGIRGIEWDAVELPVREGAVHPHTACTEPTRSYPPSSPPTTPPHLQSQFLENFAYDKRTLLGLTAHVDTGAPLPDALFDKIVAAKNYRAASAMLRQLHFATVDLELHSSYEPGGAESLVELNRRVAVTTSVLPPLPEDRFLCSFSHIFAGGYSAGYFSYKVCSGAFVMSLTNGARDSARECVRGVFAWWRAPCLAPSASSVRPSASRRELGLVWREPPQKRLFRHHPLPHLLSPLKWAEALSADAFGAFEEAGLDDEAQVKRLGGLFRETVLALGGSIPPAEVFYRFRGRAVTTEALLRHSGLAKNVSRS